MTLAKRHHNRRAKPLAGAMEVPTLRLGGLSFGSVERAGASAPPSRRRCGIHGLPTDDGRCPSCEVAAGRATLCGSCSGTKRLWNPNASAFERCTACKGRGVR